MSDNCVFTDKYRKNVREALAVRKALAVFKYMCQQNDFLVSEESLKDERDVFKWLEFYKKQDKGF